MSSISRSDVEKVIACAVGNDAKILNYSLDPFSANKSGILGEHFSLSVELEHQHHVKLCKFFVKFLPEPNMIPRFMDESVFEEEINFYNEIHPLMLADYNGEKWSAQCYLAKDNVLILEDLRTRGFTMRSEPTMDENSLKSVVATLARFHVCSILAEAKVGKPLNEAFPKFFTEKVCNDSNKFGQAVKLGYKTVILMAEKLNLDASLVLPDVYDYVSQMVKPQKQDLNVICHSDLYKNNIMFDSDNASVILDYQLLRYASPAIDISILLYLNTTPEFRKVSEINMLKHYYSVFRETLQQTNVDIDILSYEYISEKYDKCKIVGMATAVDYLPTLYLNHDVRSKIWNDPRALENFVLHSRIDVIGPELEKDFCYAKMVKDMLREFFDEAKRVLRS